MPESDQNADTAPEDTAAKDTPTDIAQESSTSEPDKAAEKDHEAEAAKWKALARKHEATAKANADAAKRLAALEDAQKSETQKLSDQLAEREVELQELRVERVRNQAGQAAKLDPELWEFITSADPDEALAQAKRLAARTAVPEPGPANLRQGSRTPAKQPPSANDALRAMAGYQ